MDEQDKACLQRNLTALTKDLYPAEVFPFLTQESILTENDVDVINAETTRRQQAFLLVTTLYRKGPKAFSVFVEALKDSHQHLHALLSGHDDQNNNSSDLALVQQELQRHYSHCLNLVSPIPWCDWFQLNLNKVYTSLRIVRGDARRGLQPTADPIKNGKKATIDDVLAPHEDSSDPKHFLVEGDAGIGKSTMCRRLTYLWSKGREGCVECNAEVCIHRFDLVFLLSAVDFCQQTSVLDVIYEQLLPDDFSVSKERLSALLKKHQCLFIVDGYDEACGSDTKLLNKIIQGGILTQASLLISCRPTYLLQKLKHFDSTFIVTGYDSPLRREFTEKFAQAMDAPLENFDRLLQTTQKDRAVKDLCRNPLNLCILCLLCAQPEQDLPASRTGLFKAVHEFIIEKAVDKLCMSHEEYEKSVLLPLYGLSYESLNRGSTTLRDQDFKRLSCDAEVLCRAGYLTKEVSLCRFRSEVCFSFSHRCFQEFLAAAHVFKMSAGERQDFLRRHLGVRLLRSCCRFLFGLLDGDEEALLQFTSIWFEHAAYSPTDHLPFEELTVFDLTECHRAHLLMQCLCELSTVPSTLADLVMHHCSPQICFSFPLCTPSCIQGLSIICRLRRNVPRSLAVVIPAYCLDSKEEEFSALLSELSHCNQIHSVGLFNIADMKQLQKALDLTRVGQEDSCINHLKLRLLGVVQGLQHQKISLGPCLHGLELYHCIMPDILQQVLNAVPQHKLTTLVIKHCSMDATCCALIPDLLSPSLRCFSLLDHSLNVTGEYEMAVLLASLAAKSQLKQLKLSHLPMQNQSMPDCLRQVMQGCEVEELNLRHCYFSTDLCHAISRVLPSMTRIHQLTISSGLIPDPEAFCLIIQTICNLKLLTDLSLENMELSEQHCSLVGQLIRECPQLTSLKLSKLNGNLVTGISSALSSGSRVQQLSCKKLGFSGHYVKEFADALSRLPDLTFLELSMHPGNYLIDHEHLELFRSLGQCPKLKKLALCKTGIEDCMMSTLCHLLASSPQIISLDLNNNVLTENAFKELADCLVLRPQRLQYLDISDCLLTEGSPVVDQLRNHCCFVRINWF